MIWYPATVLLLVQSVSGSVVLTQTYPAAPYVCRTGNITLRCQYESVENVVRVQWNGNGKVQTNVSLFGGHKETFSNSSYEEVVVDSYMNLMGNYSCAAIVQDGPISSNLYTPKYESAEVTLSSLTLASSTATTLNVTWSAGYPKCYSFTVSHSTQEGSITVTQLADSDDTFHTLTSLQPGTTYRIEVEAVRKGARGDGQRAKVMKNFTTEGEAVVSERTSIGSATTATVSFLLAGMPSATQAPNTPSPPPLGPIIGGISGGLLALAISSALLVIAIIISVCLCRQKVVPAAGTSDAVAPTANVQEEETLGHDSTKQTYAVLDWQNPDQRPVKAPDNEWFTVQYSEVKFGGIK